MFSLNYILYGEEPFLIKKRVKEIASELLGKESLSEVEYYDLNQTSLMMVFDEAKVLPFFSEHKVMVIENCDFLTTKKKASEDNSNDLTYFAQEVSFNNDTTTMIFVVDGNIDTRKSIIKEIQKLCRVEVYNQLDENDRKQYITSFFKQAKIEIKSDVKSYLISILPNDMYLMKSELEKLALYGDDITKEVVNSLINRPLEDDIFALSNAILKRDNRLVFEIWQDFKKANKEVLQLMGSLASQFRFCYQCITLRKQGYSESEIASELGCKTFRVNITLSQITGTSQDYFLSLLSKLSELDKNIKNGKIDKILGFELFLLEVGGRK